MTTIQQVLVPGEQVIWEAKPQFGPYMAGTIPALIAGLCLITAGLLPWILGGVTAGVTYVIFGILLGGGKFTYDLVNYRFISYVITDKRTFIEGGIIGRDYVAIEHDQVVSTYVKVGLADKLFGGNSGSLYIVHSGSARGRHGSPIPAGLRSITDPYKVYQMFNKVSHDIRTDIQYPNALRPDANPGYGTEYKA